MSKIRLYRGEANFNKGGHYWSTDYEWSRQFTQSGLDSEIRTRVVDTDMILRLSPLPQATKSDEIERGKELSQVGGYIGFFVDEGKFQPESVYMLKSLREDLINEYYDIQKPQGSITRKWVKKNAGTVFERKVLMYQFTTTNNNRVTVKYEFKNEVESYDEISVSFYVNDNTEEKQARDDIVDKDIISGVLYTLKQVMKSYPNNQITFVAIRSSGDTKYIKNQSYGTTIEEAKGLAKSLLDYFNNYEVTEVEPNERQRGLAIKLGDPHRKFYKWYISEDRLKDIQKDLGYLVDHIQETPTQDETFLGRYISILQFLAENTDLEEAKSLYDLLKKIRKIRLSYTDQGSPVIHNRRADVYERLMKRFFSDEYEIEKDRDMFTMTPRSDKKVAERLLESFRDKLRRGLYGI